MTIFDPTTERLYYELGETIKALRQVKGLTQEQVAGRLQMSRSALNDLEYGENTRAIPLHVVYALANALNAAPAELLPTLDTYNPPPQRDVKLETDIFDLPEDADDDDRRWVSAVLAHIEQNFRRDPLPKEPIYFDPKMPYVQRLLSLIHNITTPPILLDLIASKIGCDVVYLPHRGEKKIAGFFSGSDHPDDPARIGINSLIPRTRQRFTLAYFLVHRRWGDEFVREFPFLTADSFGFTPRGAEHRWKNNWATEVMALLMPLRMLKKDLHGQLLDFEDGEVVNRLATRYQVSPTLMTWWLAMNFGGQQKE